MHNVEHYYIENNTHGSYGYTSNTTLIKLVGIHALVDSIHKSRLIYSTQSNHVVSLSLTNRSGFIVLNHYGDYVINLITLWYVTQSIKGMGIVITDFTTHG